MTGFERSDGNVVDDPGILDAMECRFRRDLWDAAVEDAVIDHRIEARKYGPVRAMVVAGLPAEPRFNLLLGAAEPPAVEHGHLADASGCLKALGVDHYVPIAPGLGESETAEAWLKDHGYEPRQRRARFVRGAEPPDFPEPPLLEVDELTDYETEGDYFSYMILRGFDLSLCLGTLFFDLPGKEGWRCYAAIDENESAVACAATRIDDGIAQLVLDTTDESSRGRGCQMALLHRRIVDAAAAGCHTLFAETEEALEQDDDPSTAARNLRRAGFEQVSLSTVWGPPIS